MVSAQICGTGNGQPNSWWFFGAFDNLHARSLLKIPFAHRAVCSVWSHIGESDSMQGPSLSPECATHPHEGVMVRCWQGYHPPFLFIRWALRQWVFYFLGIRIPGLGHYGHNNCWNNAERWPQWKPIGVTLGCHRLFVQTPFYHTGGSWMFHWMPLFWSCWNWWAETFLTIMKHKHLFLAIKCIARCHHHGSFQWICDQKKSCDIHLAWPFGGSWCRNEPIFWWV